MKRTLLFAALILLPAIPAAAKNLRGGGCAVPGFGSAFGIVSALTATPGAISFSASNPDSGLVVGSSSATVNWVVQVGVNLLPWSVSLQATANTFTSCPSIPISAIRATCAGTSVGGGGGTATCTGGTLTLSTVAQQIASGSQGLGTQDYTVLINFALAESWRYVANSSCSLTLTYTVHAL
jgi:hypothetical protein